MSRKKNSPTQDLIGFKEFIEHQEKNIVKTNLRDSQTSYTLLTFLETESLRLNKAIELYENKIDILKKFPQDEKLIQKEQEKLQTDKEALVLKLQEADSTLTQNIDEILQLHFNF